MHLPHFDGYASIYLHRVNSSKSEPVKAVRISKVRILMGF